MDDETTANEAVDGQSAPDAAAPTSAPPPSLPATSAPASTPPPSASATGVPMRPLETLGNVELPVTIELGRTRLLMKELLSLRPGNVVELDRHVGAPVDVFVNSTLLAHGEVVVVDDELGVRITAIAGSSEEVPGA